MNNCRGARRFARKSETINIWFTMFITMVHPAAVGRPYIFGMPSGIYIARLEAGGEVRMAKMTLVR